MFLLLCILSILPNDPDVKVKGYVRDRETGLPLPNACLCIEESGYLTYTDEVGRYAIMDIQPSKYLLSVSLMGFEKKSKQVDVEIDKTARVDFYLAPSPIPMEEILVNARAPDYFVVERDYIEESNQEDLGGILSSLPGVFIRETGGSKFITIRGCDPNKVLILMDGILMNELGGRIFDISSIPAEITERIEVIKGGSIIYGMEAIGGIINILTTRKREGPKVKLELGSFGKNYYSIICNPFLSLQYSKTDDFIYKDESGEEHIRENSSSTSYNMLFKIPFKYRDIEASVKIHHSLLKNRLPGALEQTTQDASSTDSRTFLQTDITLPFLTSKTYFTGDLWEYRDPSSWSKINTGFHNISYGQILKSESIWAKGSISYGCSYLYTLLDTEDRIRPQNDMIRERERGSLWCKNTTRFGSQVRGVAIFGLRCDMVENLEPIVTPKMGIALSSGENYIFVIHVNWGKTYRVPSFHELFWVPDIFAMGNPDLLPETGTNLETGFGLSVPFQGIVNADITFFRTDIRNIIVWRRSLYDRYVPQNVSHAIISGIEEKLSWECGHAEFEANHTYLNAKNHGEDYYGNYLVLRPKHTITLRASTRYEPFFLNFEWRWVDKRAIREANTKWLSAYSVIALNLGLNTSILRKNTEIRVEIDNLTNQQYEILERYPMPMRSWSLSIRLSL